MRSSPQSDNVSLRPIIDSLYALAAAATSVYAGVSDPGASNDAIQGYMAGSLGVNTSTGRAFICRSNAVGAAVWLAIPIIGDGFVGYQPGLWYPSAGPQSAVIGSTLATGTTAFSPFIIRERCTIEAIGISITTNSGGGNAQLALYADNGSGNPGNLLGRTSSIPTDAPAVVLSAAFIGGNRQLDAGLYWTAIAYDATAGGHAICMGVNTVNNFVSLIAGASSPVTAFLLSGFTMAQSFGTWGTASGLVAVTNKDSPPACALQIASVP